MKEVSKFHDKDGLYFLRNDDGSVTIRKMKTDLDDETEVLFEVTINDSIWASIISSVSKNNGTNYQDALKFHND